MCCRLPVISEGILLNLFGKEAGVRNGQFQSADPCVAAPYITLWGIRKWEAISILIPTLTPGKERSPAAHSKPGPQSSSRLGGTVGAVSPLVSTGAPVGAFGSGSGAIWRRLLLRRPEVPGWVFSRQTWTGQ